MVNFDRSGASGSNVSVKKVFFFFFFFEVLELKSQHFPRSLHQHHTSTRDRRESESERERERVACSSSQQLFCP